MWKESIVVGLISLFHHERRKQNSPGYYNERRKDDGKLTMTKARKTLTDSLDKFTEAVTRHKK